MKHVIFFVVLCIGNILNAQSNDIKFLSDRSFNSKIKAPRVVTVVEFWAEWNAYNQCNYLKKLKECKVYRVNIDDSPALVKRYNVKVVPTVIVFESGKVIEKYEANLMFQAAGKFSYDGIQHAVDSLILKRFE